jgi:uncharacterized protein (DUF433 family)
MNPKPIEQAKNPLLARALPALRRARLRAESIAAATNTALIQVVDGKIVRVYPGRSLGDQKLVTREELSDRISIDPNICFGKPCIRGHRIWVSLILDLLASGETFEQLLAKYPGIEEADIRACIAYGAEMTSQRIVAPQEGAV